jgi:signal transduction histidine kinase
MLLVAIAASAASDTVSEGLFLVALATFGTIPFAFLVGLVRARLARGSVGGLVVELGEDPLDGDVRGALARSLRDPSLELAFWLPDEETYVDAAGRPYLPPADASRATTVVSHGGERVALLIHDPALGDDPDLVEAACAAAGLALSNERLQAELRRHVDELRASRARIVGAGDAARRRIERDLHDGAQQRLVSLAIMLRRAEDAGDPAAARALLARARTELDDAIRELRELARGIHPAVLTDRGLEAALTALVDRSGVHATLTIDLPERPPREVEIAAYYVVAEALSNAAKHASEARVEVEVTRDPAGVRVRVADDGPGGAHVEPQGGLRGLADRVEAIGGRLRVGPSDAGGTAVVAVVPLRGRT